MGTVHWKSCIGLKDVVLFYFLGWHCFGGRGVGVPSNSYSYFRILLAEGKKKNHSGNALPALRNSHQ